MEQKTLLKFIAPLCAALALSACGGGGGGGSNTPKYTVGGTVSGMAGSGLVLQNNSGDDLTVNADGSFTFVKALTDSSDYTVSVLTQPTSPNQYCSVTSGSGTLAGADVTDVTVDCVAAYTIGGTVTGLSGSGLTLQNNAGDGLTVTSNGNFTFTTALTDSSSYEVSVLAQPTSPDQICTVTSGGGNIAGADVTDVSVNCVTTYTISGSVTGLSGTGLVLQNNAGDDLAISASGSFTFATALTDESNYEVSVLSQPTSPSQTCTVTSGSGTLSAADIADVAINCVTNTYTIGGTLSALPADTSVTVQNNGVDLKTLTANGSFTFSVPLDDLSYYEVTVLTQPTASYCTVQNGGGRVISGDVMKVEVNCGIFMDSGQSIGFDDTYSVVLKDVDGDGDVDLVAGNQGQANRVYLNDGTGNFADSGQALGSASTISVALGDVDGDGDPDMVAGNNWGEANQVYLNDGSGGFTDSGQQLGTYKTLSVALGDVDNDGDLDIVAGNQAGAANRVYLNDGSGNFTDSSQAVGANDTHSVALGDVDGDGDLDLVEGNHGAFNEPCEPTRVYLNDGSGNFSDSGQSLGAEYTDAVTLGDVDGDGDLDIVEGNGSNQPNHVYLNDGAGQFTDSGQSLGSGYTEGVSLGDVDGDGDLDLVAGNFGNASVVYLNDGSGNYTDSGQVLGTDNTFSVAIDDVDGDGDLDFVTGNFFGHTNHLYFNVTN